MRRKIRQSASCSDKSKTIQDFFTELPSEIIVNILLRLPLRTIISCKCVCKSLLKLVESREFASSHLSESAPALALLHRAPRLFKLYEIKDVVINLKRDLLGEFNLPHHTCICGSAKGLLLLRDDQKCVPPGLYICNPITRDYIKFPCPQELASEVPVQVSNMPVGCGFGTSKITDQYKVVMIYDIIGNQKPSELQRVPRFECQVYTLGTGSWRRIDRGPTWGSFHPLEYNHLYTGVFVNGNLHWLTYDAKSTLEISYFDLETELFSTFSLPPLTKGSSRWELSTLHDCLCLFGNSSERELVIWLMKEYGVETSWIIIWKKRSYFYDSIVRRPIKVYRNGRVLMALKDCCIFVYSRIITPLGTIDNFIVETDIIESIIHTPSFLSLRSFELENVESF